jgi:hypothetical protein
LTWDDQPIDLGDQLADLVGQPAYVLGYLRVKLFLLGHELPCFFNETGEQSHHLVDSVRLSVAVCCHGCGFQNIVQHPTEILPHGTGVARVPW